MSDVNAATTTNSWVASTLCVIDARTNGPEPCAVFQTVKHEVIATAVAAPNGPKRSAAQISTGKTMYGTSRCDGTSISTMRTVRRSAASRELHGAASATSCRAAQTRMSGANTSAPEKSPSHQVRKTRAELVRLDHVAEPERDDAEGGADQRSEGGARDEGQDVPDPLERDSLLRQSAEQHRRHDDFERVPDRLTEDRPPRRREVGEQQIADDDSRARARGPRMTSAAMPTPTGGHSAVTVPCR